MNRKIILMSLLTACLLVAGSALADLVTYDYEPLGTMYGTPAGHVPGDFMFAEYGANLYVTNFLSGGTPYFNFARIDAAFTGPSIFFGNNQILNVNNVGVIFQFSSAGDVVFDYLQLGGTVNLQVNGYSTVLEAPDLPSLIGVVAPGVTLAVTTTPVAGGTIGHVTLTGPVSSLRLGGQELYLDDVDCRNGYNPNLGECDFLVSHETLTAGMGWSPPTSSPGDVIFTEDGIPVSLWDMTYLGGGTNFIACSVEPTPEPSFGTNLTMNLNNIANIYNIDALGITVSQVTFEFLDYGGYENLQVNGATLYIGELDTIPTAVAPGVTFSVTTAPVTGGKRGTVTLTGNVQKLLVAGQEFYVDNVCVTKDNGGGASPCTIVSDNESQPFGSAWGSAYGNAPGDVMFTEDGIIVGLEMFNDGFGMQFQEARIDNAFCPIGSGQALLLANICATYDLSAHAPVQQVSFDYCDGAGVENLQVDGTLYVGQIETLPATYFPGVTAAVTVNSGPGYQYGTVTLTGNVNWMWIGGQQFAIDDVCVIPDSTGTSCDRMVSHESLSAGMAWSSTTNVPGDVIFTEDGIPVSVWDMVYLGGGTNFLVCSIQPSPEATFGTNLTMNLNNIANEYDIAALGLSVYEVSFEFLDYGGYENLQVNGATLHIGEMDAMPTAVAPGVTFSATSVPVTGGKRGIVTLTGNVQKLRVAGQEFYVDNLCVKGRSASTVPVKTDAMVALDEPFPNPFNPRTTLSFSLAREGHVRLSVVDLRGRRITTLVDGLRSAGAYQLVWNGSDDRGAQVPSGTYFVLLESETGIQTRKITLLK